MQAQTELTVNQKMHALSNAMYQGGVKWIPKAGDYYTSSRADLELYKIVSIENGKIKTKYAHSDTEPMEWDEETFLTKGFGVNRIHVPNWIFEKIK